MSSPSHYEINVAGPNGHIFATAERSIRSERKLKEVYDMLLHAFPPEDGYSLSVSHWQCSGHSVEGYPFQ